MELKDFDKWHEEGLLHNQDDIRATRRFIEYAKRLKKYLIRAENVREKEQRKYYILLLN